RPRVGNSRPRAGRCARDAGRRVRFRCWAGELPALNRRNVRERLEQEERLPGALQRKLRALYAHATTSAKDGAK
ncbi:MAG: hypothetical protein NZ553_17555, partial [Caldilinea sp.]|nr:hypothetical protein [Caldilinea sp.]MDW8442288.1 hypothetical protein [Caldilineaceae bacterium]